MLRELTKRTRDYLVSFGERMSVRMMAAYLNKENTSAKFYDAWDVGMVSDSNFMSAELLDEVWQTIPEKLGGYKTGEIKEIPIVTGFIAKDKKGTITTLGRGGSDLSATMIGAALGNKNTYLVERGTPCNVLPGSVLVSATALMKQLSRENCLIMLFV